MAFRLQDHANQILIVLFVIFYKRNRYTITLLQVKKSIHRMIFQNLDADSIMNIMDENSEIGRHLKKAWETQDVEQPEQESFMVYVVIKIYTHASFIDFTCI